MKSKQKLIEKWESAIEVAEFYGKGKEERLIEYMREFVSDLNQLDEPKITELDALNRLAQNVQFSADEIANHLERLSAHNGQVTYGNQEILSQNWINEHRKSYTMEDSVEVSELQNLLVPKQEEVDQAYKDGYEKGKEHTFYKGFLEGLADKESEPEKVVVPQFVADWYESEGKRSSWWNWFYKWGRDESRTELESKTIRWMQDYNEEKFVDIFRYGYEVEAEQKYHVTDENDTLLCKSNGVVMTVGKLWAIGNEREAEYYLTEQEIKDYDERFWAFAVPVDGGENKCY